MDALATLLAELTPKPRAVSAAEAAALRAQCTLLREEPVLGGEPLRLFACGERAVALEVDDRGEPLLRAWPAREVAEAWFERRLADYERLWDG
jgi:hypothetical protein